MIFALLGWMIFLLPFVVVLGGIGLVVFFVTRSARRTQRAPTFYAPPPPGPQPWGPPQRPVPPHSTQQGWNPPRP